jgi:microcystin-dependent protein
MSEPFIAEIRIFAGNFAPRSWAFCDGQLLPISQNTALFSLIGTTYGGDGRTTTALPNLQGRAPMHPGNGAGLSQRRLGQQGGVESVLLTQTELPAHNHTLKAGGNTAAGVVATPVGNTIGFAATAMGYTTPNNLTTMAGLPNAGGSQGHNNMQPFMAMNFIIALQGIYPSRS